MNSAMATGRLMAARLGSTPAHRLPQAPGRWGIAAMTAAVAAVAAADPASLASAPLLEVGDEIGDHEFVHRERVYDADIADPSVKDLVDRARVLIPAQHPRVPPPNRRTA